MENNKKVLRLRPEVKDFLIAVSLGKYLLGAFAFVFMIAMLVCAFFMGEGAPFSELALASLNVSLFMIGIAIILATLLDMLAAGAKWLLTHRIIFLKIEKRDIVIK